MTVGEQVSRSSVLASNNEALTESLRRDQEKQWKRWLEEEERCRLGWGIYVSLTESNQRIEFDTEDYAHSSSTPSWAVC